LRCFVRHCIYVLYRRIWIVAILWRSFLNKILKVFFILVKTADFTILTISTH
jgi:hypothetical protein